ncbi:1,4-alpha-glucan branching protein GlgB [Lachnospiraceae bacterium 48-33]
MKENLNDLMNWADIEGLQYADIDCPRCTLGPSERKGKKTLIQVFVLDATSVSIRFDKEKKLLPMEKMDENFFALLVSGTNKGLYHVIAEFEDGSTVTYYDPYQFDNVLPIEELKKFNAGVNYEIYKYLGAHPAEIQGVKGMTFGVWAPFAERVSVVGDFNQWDGRRHMMNKIDDTGVFELFIPEISTGELYKYEIRQYGEKVVLKADPYAFLAQKRPDNASITTDISSFKWTDEKWIKAREKKKLESTPMSIYEVHLGSWKKPEIEGVEEKESFYTYREIAPLLAEYVLDMHYTHIELMPVMEHPFDGSWGYQVTGYYAPTSRYGNPEDFAYFMDYMHSKGIGVILDWVPAHFPKDEFGLARFDGTCLYEHQDPRQGEHPHWGTLIYNYARPEVKSFLTANALFWAEQYHADAIRMDAVASMLYLDYGKNDGEWVANMYGGHENLDAIAFLQQLNTQFKKRTRGALIIAEESTAWPKVTGSPEEDGLGFDLKWNMGWMNDFTNYMKCDPYYRKDNYNLLTFSMVYAYSENFILVLSHDEVVHGKGSMIGKMPGADEDIRFSNLRAAYTFMFTHPGKKLLFMGQDFGGYREWSEERELDWKSLLDEKHKFVQNYVKELNRLYTEEPALHELDQSPEGFEWINCSTHEKSICAFIRKGTKPEDTLYVFCNFDTVPHARYKFGVLEAGQYREILNSDDDNFGGFGMVNSKTVISKPEECDGRENTISIKLGPVSVSIFKYEGPVK